MIPDEARIIKLFSIRNIFPIIKLKIYGFKFNPKDYEKPLFRMQLINKIYEYFPIIFSSIGIEAECEHVQLTPNYINNLCRLGIIEISESIIADHNLYEKLENHLDIQEFKRIFDEKEPEKTVIFERGMLGVTILGKQFCKSCSFDRN